MKNNKTFGLGDLFIATAFLLMLFRMTGVITTSWVALNNFNIFVIIYLIVCFLIDVIIKVIDVIIKKRDE